MTKRVCLITSSLTLCLTGLFFAADAGAATQPLTKSRVQGLVMTAVHKQGCAAKTGNYHVPKVSLQAWANVPHTLPYLCKLVPSGNIKIFFSIRTWANSTSNWDAVATWKSDPLIDGAGVSYTGVNLYEEFRVWTYRGKYYTRTVPLAESKRLDRSIQGKGKLASFLEEWTDSSSTTDPYGNDGP